MMGDISIFTAVYDPTISRLKTTKTFNTYIAILSKIELSNVSSFSIYVLESDKVLYIL